MGWFEEQVQSRKEIEAELLSDAFENIARSVTGGSDVWIQKGEEVQGAISQLLKYFRIKEKEVPAKCKDLEDKLDFLLSSSGVLYRRVRLERGWSADAMGVMMTTVKNDAGEEAVVTVLPLQNGGFSYVDPFTSKRVHVTVRNEAKLGEEGYCFYRPLPQRPLKLKDLFIYMGSCLSRADLISFLLAAAAITLVGMLLPKLNAILMGPVIANGSYQLLFGVMMFMLCVTLSNLVLGGVRSLLLTRLSTKLDNNVQAASMMRLLSLPASFFKKYSSGELAQYMAYLNNLCNTLVSSIFSTGVTGVFSLVYLTQIFNYAPSLVVPSLIVTVLTLAVSMVTAKIQTGLNKERMEISAKERGMTFNLVSGVQKIRLTGAENRAFAKWANLYAQESLIEYNPPALVLYSSVITTAIGLLGTAAIYYIAVKNSVTIAEYYAFNAAYAYISTAFSSLASVAVTAATLRPTLELVKPLMEAEPEAADGKETVTRLSGSIEMSHVSFRYDPQGPLILNDLSLTIPARQYVAIVGRTGCGKSTLMRMLLGFEQPASGAVYYDKKDTRKLDMRSVRKLIGTVTQDGKLFNGSIYENIAISQPTLTQEEAWEAAEIAGIADDIRAMPMGMHTIVAEGSGGVSGGQRQRLMIARAVAPKPKILFFDEATSALDNITQKRVAEALDGMKCTRIVIAHRLSTVRHCDRIIVLDGGKIIEDGTYEELIAKNGFFADLVARQRLDNEELPTVEESKEGAADAPENKKSDPVQ